MLEETRGPGRPPLEDDPETILLSERRRDIFRLIQKHPGISVLEVEQRLQVGAGTFYHHLDRLMRAGLVETRKGVNVTRLYPADKAPPPDAPALAHDTAKEVARTLLRKPGLSSREISEHMGRPQRTVVFHLRALLEAGYVEQDKTHKAPTYHPTERLREGFSFK